MAELMQDATGEPGTLWGGKADVRPVSGDGR